ncbi:pirin family protein [soil metagenome]
MLTLRPANTRGVTKIGCLDSQHSFSFGNYRDAKNTHFRSLRVINDDRIAAGAGFGTHPHDNMEILTYVLAGEIAHKDSTGAGGTLGPGDIQHMTAGGGVLHSEFNPSQTNPTHLFQIWLMPTEDDAPPAYNERLGGASARRDTLQLIAAPDGANGAIAWKTGARLYAGNISEGTSVRAALAPGRYGYIQVMTGAARVNGTALGAGDAATTVDETSLEIVGGAGGAEVLVFDLE